MHTRLSRRVRKVSEFPSWLILRAGYKKIKSEYLEDEHTMDIDVLKYHE